MIYRVIPTVIVLALILIGYVIKRKRIATYNQRAKFTVDFNNSFFVRWYSYVLSMAIYKANE